MHLKEEWKYEEKMERWNRGKNSLTRKAVILLQMEEYRKKDRSID